MKMYFKKWAFCLGLVIVTITISMPCEAQVMGRVVHNDPTRLRTVGFVAEGYFDSYKVNHNGGFRGGVMIHAGKVVQLDFIMHIDAKDRVYKENPDAGVGQNGRLELLIAFKFDGPNSIRTVKDRVTINGSVYEGDVNRRRNICPRFGFSFGSSAFDEKVHATFTDSLGNEGIADLGYMNWSMAVFGFSYKQTQNTWIDFGDGKPHPMGHYLDIYVDALLLTSLNMGEYNAAYSLQDYPVKPWSKITTGFRTGFTAVHPIRSGITYGMEFGVRPGVSGLETSSYRNSGYFIVHFGVYLAIPPDKPNVW